ncbi:hypothetical protein BKA66DRAFT_579803 [Pyrenochaeta sp. MPI-SDFR-AT-0127]|nr:hypothetical protein BKA66DRAFT_579803 [Pyrenochaeta sp. MPI-SDFR-AT-0127]
MAPYILVGLLLLFHLPTCFIRVVRWESAQYLALGLAMLGVALTVQAYVSTALAAGEVLVWMPLTLILDAGAMIQMAILIIEKYHVEGKDGVRRGGLRVLWRAVRDTLQSLGRKRQEQRIEAAILLPDLRLPAIAPQVGNQQLDPEIEQPQTPPVPHCAFHYAIVALISFIFFLTLVVLQMYGLYAAVQGRRQTNITTNWCSPAFRDFAVAVTTGNCQKYPVLDSSSNGIGCISLPGDQQRNWLLGTIIALSLAILSETLDFILLICTDSTTKYRGVKMQRPWLTMFGGVIMLIVLITFGVQNANALPKGVTETVWIYRKEPSRSIGRVCRGTLSTPGLRGMMIGYMDGLFESWGAGYRGS